MNYGDILQRAWRITWNNKYLWWLGILLALGSGGGYNPNFNTPGRGGSGGGGGAPPTGGVPNLPDFAGLEEVIAGSIAIIAVLICLFLIVAIVFWIVSLIARGGLISATVQIEEQERSSFREGWAAGRKPLMRMLGISLIQGIPGLGISLVALIVFLMVVGVGAFADAANDPQALIASMGAAMLCIIPLMCIGWLVSLALAILRPFADRACVIDNQSAVAAYRQGWEVLRSNFADSLVLGIIRVVGGSIVGFIIAIPLTMLFFGGILGGAAAAVGFEQTGGDAAALLAPAIIALCCLFAVVFIFATVVNGVVATYFSAMWTLAYREFDQRKGQLDAPAV